jgi:O-6-methylguanine DNA methyltransferase
MIDQLLTNLGYRVGRYTSPHLESFTERISIKGEPINPAQMIATYKDIAIALGNPQSVRSVGQANHQNPIPLFIPCHRIIGMNGKLVGYRGGLAIKAKLLEIEKQGLANPLNWE